MRNLRTSGSAAIIAALLAVGCNNNNDSSVSPPAIAKAGTNNGDSQNGPASQALPTPLKVEVTRDGTPAESVMVSWATTGGGTLSPTTQATDADGVSSSIWTLGEVNGAQLATASISTTGANATVTFTATATSGSSSSTIEVLSANAQETNRFSPSALVVPVGTTVTWEWVDPNIGHNVVPDDGSTPAPSGSLVSGPHTYRYTFNTPGTFRYHCQAHGSPNGVGMSGTVTVVPAGT